MVFKINLSEKGKTYHFESDSEFLIGKKIGEKFRGNELLPEPSSYELEIKGTSDIAGLPGSEQIEGPALARLLLKKGKFLRRVPHKGFRRKKSVRGNEISLSISQINLSVVKKGTKALEEIFPEQNKKKEENKQE